jgi:hypothetical protein
VSCWAAETASATILSSLVSTAQVFQHLEHCPWQLSSDSAGYGYGWNWETNFFPMTNDNKIYIKRRESDV